MLYSLKQLIVILTIATIVFHFAKPIALKFTAEEDFSRRRRVWYILTFVSFFSPSIWLYSLIAIPVLLSAGRKDSNPIALYLLMLHVVPPVGAVIPVFGNNGLFEFDNYRLLAFFVLWPAANRHRKLPKDATGMKFGLIDWILVIFGLLDIALYTAPDFPHHYYMPDSPTNALRRGFLFIVDIYILYYAVSRTCRTREKLLDAAATFCVACAVLATIAMFEQARVWLLYGDLTHRWGTDPTAGTYLTRGGALRAQASAGHALALGYLLAVASGFWLYFGAQIQSRAYRIGVTLLLWGGLYATSSRGPWLGAAIIYFSFKAIGPQAVSRLAKSGVAAAVLAGIVAISPMGPRILEMLPVMGQTKDFNVLYRERLAERGWQLVAAHPFFGDQFPWPEMEDLRQGEGIIDIVNTYLGMALNYGLVGLVCFVSVILIETQKVYVGAKRIRQSDPNFALFGASLIACIVGTLVMIQSNSFGLGLQKMFYVLTGFATGYAYVVKSQRPTPRESG